MKQSGNFSFLGRLLISSALLTSGQLIAADDGYNSYVILGEAPSGNNIAIARTIIDTNETCPSVSEVGSNNSVTMISRDNPNGFNVLVCEALIEFDKRYQINFSSGAITLPMAKSNPENILVYGDTGCSHCEKGTAAEPFKTMADSGAAKNADLVLHMGDFNYRGTSGDTLFSEYQNGQWGQYSQGIYDAGDGDGPGQHCGQASGQPFYSQSAQNSNRPDIWENWQDDVFLAADKLLASAPWIVARGNHELCSRAGPGYFYFLDSNTRLTGGKQLSCPVPDVGKGAEINTVQIPNYVVSFEHLDIVVIDSANACDDSANSPFTKKYQKVFSELENQVGKTTTWLMTHRPIWGVEQRWGSAVPCTSKGEFGCVNQMMQTAIKQQKSGKLPSSVDLVFSGHMHLFESVSFPDSSRPPNIVVGSSGVHLTGGQPYGGASTVSDGLKALVVSPSTTFQYNSSSYDSFGYLSVKVASDGSWQGHLINTQIPEPLVVCDSQQNLKFGVCELGKGITVP